MGVRGLTTFIAQNSDRYLKRYELHDTYLVIDGNNLASQLYKWHAKCYDCFGGDYDKYSKTVKNFFNILKECNVIPLIVLDGGYEDKKLKTVYSRVRTRIRQSKQLNCITESSMTVFPLFLRELFVEITMQLSLKIVRCLLEADYEMACIARKLNCPLLSYDSDFFIFDVEYIPFNTVIFNSVKYSSKGKYKYLDCQIYRIDYFLKAYGGMRKDCIPLLGVLLGNDYIHINIFHNFYKHLKKSKSKPGHSDQQRRIRSLITWLQNENFESAFRKVLGRIKQIHRPAVAQQILSVANNYVCSESELLQYFNLDNINTNQILPTINVNMDTMLDIETDSSELSEESDNEEISESSESDINALIEDDKKCNILQPPLLPEYFEDRYKRCLYPACFIDIIFHSRHIFIPVIENYSEPPCHTISLSILSAICRILNSNSSNAKYVLRNERGRMQSFELPKSLKVLPSLSELEGIDYVQSLKYMLDVLEIKETFLNILNEFPISWRLYTLSIVYWIKNSSTQVNECFIYALLISAILLKTVDSECQRNEINFLKKFQKLITNIKANPIVTTGNTSMTPNVILDTITYNDGIMFMKEIITNFDMIIKLKKNPKLFDSNIVHVFAQFQSCAFYIKYLNSLLNNPFEDYLISDLYNGTLIYNLSNNFLSRPKLDSYIQLLLKSCPNIYNAFIVIKTYLLTDMPNLYIKNSVFKRRKKKKKTQETNDERNRLSDDTADDEEEEDIYDANNRFSVLKI